MTRNSSKTETRMALSSHGIADGTGQSGLALAEGDSDRAVQSESASVLLPGPWLL